MPASILSTGNEVLLGDITDTNSAYLARQMASLGLPITEIRVVGDREKQISQALEELSLTAEICIVTGGLGPTLDDCTAAASARASGSDLRLNGTALSHMEAYFKKRGFDLTRENMKQAMLPESSTPIINHNGTAPGFFLSINRCLFFFLPGVPAEMKMMFQKEVKPEIEKQLPQQHRITIERITVFGMGESRVGGLLEGFEPKFPGFSLGFRAVYPLVEVKVVAKSDDIGTDHTDADDPGLTLEAAKNWVVARLENKVISTKGLSMAQEVGRLLVEKKKTIAVAESCTGGLIANWLTDVPGSSDYFMFSGVTYANDAKIDILGVKKSTIVEHGAVDERTAIQMADGARISANADYAISTTGIAGPSGGTDDKPVGMVCVGLSGPSGSDARTYYFTSGDRRMNKEMFAAVALNRLRKQLARC